MKKEAFVKVALVVFGCGLALGVQAASVSGASSASAFTASGDDLLQTGVRSVTNNLVQYYEEGYVDGTASTLTDGTAGSSGREATLAVSGGSILYVLDTASHPGGYDITAIDTFSGWQDTGRVNQHYTVSFRKVGSATFGDGNHRRLFWGGQPDASQHRRR